LKIAFTTSGRTIDSPLDSRFGRAPNFLIYDLDNETYEIIDNQQNLNAAQGAGIQSAQTVARMGVSCLVTGHCGPKAFMVLSAANVKIYSSNAPTVSEALTAYKKGTLEIIKSADVEGHWM